MGSYKIYHGKCENKLDLISDNSIDLAITSPPYNVNLGKNKYNKNPYDLYNDNKNHQEYIIWLESVFQKIYNKLKSGGRCVIVIGDGLNGGIPTHSDITQFMTQKLNYLIMTTIIWDKHHVRPRYAWGSFASPSSPSFPKPFDFVLIFAKENKKLQEKGETDLAPDEFKKWAYGLWEIAPEGKVKLLRHPAPFPLELPIRLIKMLSWKNSIVLDPFMGSGTTGVACMKLHRNFIGMEISEKYCKIAEKRIEAAIPVDIFEEEN